MVKTMIPLLLAMLLATVVQAEDVQSPKGRAELFLTTVGKGQIGPAYDALFSGSPIPAEKPQMIDAVKRQTEAMIPLYGKSLGFELITERAFGTSLIRLTYLQRLEKHPLVWRFWFYKPSDHWYISYVIFNDQFGFLPED